MTEKKVWWCDECKAPRTGRELCMGNLNNRNSGDSCKSLGAKLYSIRSKNGCATGDDKNWWGLFNWKIFWNGGLCSSSWRCRGTHAIFSTISSDAKKPLVGRTKSVFKWNAAGYTGEYNYSEAAMAYETEMIVQRRNSMETSGGKDKELWDECSELASSDFIGISRCTVTIAGISARNDTYVAPFHYDRRDLSTQYAHIAYL